MSFFATIHVFIHMDKLPEIYSYEDTEIVTIIYH